MLLIASVLVVLALTYPLWLPHLYSYLDVSQSPQIADVIVVLGGSNGRREAFAVSLYDHGYAPKILVSGHKNSMLAELKVIAKSDIPTKSLLINDQATNTFDESQQILSHLIRMNVKSVLIVTDRFHTRRALATYKHVFQGFNIEITIVSPEDNILAGAWWKSEINHEIAQEYLKMPFYWLIYGIWSG